MDLALPEKVVHPNALRGSACATVSLSSADAGLFLFFIFFGLSMLLMQFIAGFSRLYAEGYVPKFLLLARAHSLPLSLLVRRVLWRR